jgi:exosortase
VLEARATSDIGGLKSRQLAAGLMLAATIFVPWQQLISLSLTDDRYSHIILVPFIAAALIYFDKEKIFRNMNYNPLAGVLMAAVGIALCNLSRIVPSFSGNIYNLAVSIFGGIVILAADLLLCFGFAAFRRAAFPLSFLLLMIPVPAPLMSPLIRALQNGSAEFSAVLFKLIHLPAFRQDLRFSLPGFDIEIAEQCSGIRSSIALVIANTLAGHLFLQSWWRKVLLILITVPLVIFKNAVRIVTISSLGVYVSQSFLYGKLHHYSGLPFSLVEVAIVAPILVVWHKSEARRLQAKTTAA